MKDYSAVHVALRNFDLLDGVLLRILEMMNSVEPLLVIVFALTILNLNSDLLCPKFFFFYAKLSSYCFIIS